MGSSNVRTLSGKSRANKMRNKLVQRKRKKLRANSNILSGKSDRDKNRDVEYYLIYFFLGWLKFDLMPECVCDLL